MILVINPSSFADQSPRNCHGKLMRRRTARLLPDDAKLKLNADSKPSSPDGNRYAAGRHDHPRTYSAWVCRKKRLKRDGLPIMAGSSVHRQYSIKGNIYKRRIVNNRRKQKQSEWLRLLLLANINY